MGRRMAAALVSMALAAPLCGELVPRFVVETFAVGTAMQPEPLPVALKLDTATGDTWRFAGTEFFPVFALSVRETEDATTGSAAAAGRKSHADVEQKLHRIIIPEVNFRNAAMRDVVEFLATASRQHDPVGEGVNLVLKTVPSQTEPGPDPFAPVTRPVSVADTLITFEAKQVALDSVLKVTLDMAQMTYRIRGGIVMVGPMADSEEFSWRRYDLLPATVERLHGFHPSLFEEGAPVGAQEERWKDFFKTFGMTWPTAASVQVFPSLGIVNVRNTEGSLDLFDTILKTINSSPPRNGRFVFVPLAASAQAPSALLLLDSETGASWRYEIGEVDEVTRTIKVDRIVPITSRTTER